MSSQAFLRLRTSPGAGPLKDSADATVAAIGVLKSYYEGAFLQIASTTGATAHAKTAAGLKARDHKKPSLPLACVGLVCPFSLSLTSRLGPRSRGRCSPSLYEQSWCLEMLG